MTPWPVLISAFHLHLLLRIGSFSCILSIEILYACCKSCLYNNQQPEGEEYELRSTVSLYTYNFPCPSSLVPTSIIRSEKKCFIQPSFQLLRLSVDRRRMKYEYGICLESYLQEDTEVRRWKLTLLQFIQHKIYMEWPGIEIGLPRLRVGDLPLMAQSITLHI